MYAEKLFSIGSFGPNLYGVMIAVGLALCFVFIQILGKRIGIEKSNLDFYELNGLASVGLGFLFATIFQYIYALIENPKTASFGGMTFMGGLIGGVLTFSVITLIYARWKPEVKKDLYKFLEAAMPCVLIAHAFGRIGCFFAGCCYGMKTSGPLGMVFPYGSSSGPVLPTMLIEAIFLFILCAVTIFFINKKFAYNTPLYILGYSIFRFTIEFFRGDNRGEFLPGLSPTQFWCILLFIAGAALLTLMLIYKFKKDKEKIPKFLMKLPEGFDNIYKSKPKDTPLKIQKNHA